jgi:glucosamine-6-phosphate deaminase
MMVMGLSNLNCAEARLAEKIMNKPIKIVTLQRFIDSSFAKLLFAIYNIVRFYVKAFRNGNCIKIEERKDIQEGLVMGKMVNSFVIEKLKVKIFSSRIAMGQAAGQAVAKKMEEMLKEKKHLFMVFAAAPSQNEFLEELSKASGLDWKRVTAFHLDEYVGLSETAPQNFGRFLKERLFDKVYPGKVHYLNGMAKDPETECERYAALFKDHPFDIACIGIGENGHLAFNDPPVADFRDPRPVKIVQLDLTSRQQQVNDGCFRTLEEVPKRAMTLTLPTIFSAKFIYCMVPGPTKADAVEKTLEGPITTDCPASTLRRHQQATLYLDEDSARRISNLIK